MNAQEIKIDGKAIIYTIIVENTGSSPAMMHKNVVASLANIYRNIDRDNHLILDTDEHVSSKGSFVKVYTKNLIIESINYYNYDYHRYDVEHTVDVFFKENRMKIQISCDLAKYYMGGKRTEYKDFFLGESCAAQGYNCSDKPALKQPTYDATVQAMKEMANDIKQYVLKHRSDDDW